ncbi:MAG: mechanosensitive ion channel [Planctomycetota bacterium]|nr:mechanosensitive ion channel [Planctomycetota bacterium]
MLLMWIGFWAFSTSAQGETAAPPAIRNLETPRNAVYSFMMAARDGDWAEAGSVLQRPDGGWEGNASASEIARALKLLLDRTIWIEWGNIPGADASLSTVTIGTIGMHAHKVDVVLNRIDGVWKFSSNTTEAVPTIARDYGVWWIIQLPPYLLDTTIAEIELWQWIGLTALALIGALTGMAVSHALRRGSQTEAAHRSEFVSRSVAALATPIGLLIGLIAIRMSGDTLSLSIPAQTNVSLGCRAFTTLIVAWAFVRWIRVFASHIESTLAARGISDAGPIIRIVRALLVFLIMMLGVSAALQIFGLDLSAVIAGLGIGAAAIALASQQTLSNLFGGASVMADRVVKPGDSCQIGSISGTVERIGLRSTQLRTADRTLLIVANGDLSQSRVENLSNRDGFRFQTTLNLKTDTTTTQLRAVIADVTAALKVIENVDASSISVNLTSIHSAAFDVEASAIVTTTDGAAFTRSKETTLFEILNILAKQGCTLV